MILLFLINKINNNLVQNISLIKNISSIPYMAVSKKTKSFAFRLVAKVVRTSRLYKFFKFSDDSRPKGSFKLMFFCGKSGIEYLNASLFSIYRFWKFLPDIVIISDGTPLSFFKENLVKWPRSTSIIAWEECANFYKNKGNNDIYTYASKDLWGKKFAAILYCAEHFPTLYSDTDVLWYSSPEEDILLKPILKMAQDIAACYSNQMLNVLQQEECLTKTPLNAGVIYANGDFSTFNKWKPLCEYLSSNADNRSEQTAFAILNNHFNENDFWSEKKILIKADDVCSIRYTKKYFPNIIARHYVTTKNVSFWRDFLYMLLGH